MTTLSLDEVKSVELDVLSELDRVCREYNLSYALAYGTLIGALRHGGFIPWDDDIDVYMPRDDYEKLYELWQQGVFAPHYALASYRDRSIINSYCKLVDTRTCAVESFLSEESGTLGLWVDIFPLEKVSLGDPTVRTAAKRGKRLVWWKYIAASNPRYATSPLRRAIKYLIYPITALTDLYKIARNQDTNGKSVHRGDNYEAPDARWVLLVDDAMERNIITPDELFPLRTATFEGREFYIPAKAEKILDDYYGNWQRIPPEEERPHAHLRSVQLLDNN